MKYIHKSKDWLIENYQLAIIMIVVLFFVCNSLFTGNDDNKAIIHQQDTSNEVKLRSSEEKDVDKIDESKSTKDVNRNVVVDVKGAVNFPNTYTMSSKERVHDVLKKAQTKHNADLSKINLSERLKDQMYIYVPINGEHVPSVNTNQSTNDKVEVNINTGDKSEIEKLPGIGPSKADAILQYRETNGEFKTVDDLKKVKGFGDKTVESLKDFIILN